MRTFSIPRTGSVLLYVEWIGELLQPSIRPSHSGKVFASPYMNHTGYVSVVGALTTTTQSACTSVCIATTSSTEHDYTKCMYECTHDGDEQP